MIEVRVPYELNGRSFEGVIVCGEDATDRKRPVLFMQPDWYGVCDETIAQARELAGDRYVVFLADMFGADYHGDTKQFDDLLAGMLAVHLDLDFALSCGDLALRSLGAEAKRRNLVDPAQPTFAVGYCAGAGFLMEQARAGAAFDSIVIFHITNPKPVVPGTPCKVKGPTLTIHGSADPVTSREDIAALEAELSEAGVEWQTVMFGGAVHSFCVPSANFPGAQYDARLCRKSYVLMHDHFADSIAA